MLFKTNLLDLWDVIFDSSTTIHLFTSVVLSFTTWENWWLSTLWKKVLERKCSKVTILVNGVYWITKRSLRMIKLNIWAYNCIAGVMKEIFIKKTDCVEYSNLYINKNYHLSFYSVMNWYFKINTHCVCAHGIC